MSVSFLVGGTSFPADSVTVERRIQTLLSPAQVPYGEKHQWRCSCRLLGSGPAALAPAARTFEQTLGRQYQDVSLVADDGTILWTLPNSTSVGGVKVTDLVNPNEPGSWAAVYPMQFTIEATYPYTNAGVIILESSETISYIGGGARYGFTECTNALPQKFLLTPFTVARATQSGQLRSLNGPGNYALPLYPAEEMQDQRRQDVSTRLNDQGLTEYTISWQYEFASSTKFV